MAREELVAKQVLEYKAAYESVRAAIKELNRKMPWRSPRAIPHLDIDDAKRYWRDQYKEVLLTLATSGSNAREALAREAYCEKPAKPSSDKKGGARDVAIWLSVIDYLRNNPKELVYFVSSNTKDFGDGSDYPSPMAEDLDYMASRLEYLTSFNDFVSRFSQRIEADNDHVKEILLGLPEPALRPIRVTAQSILKDGWFKGTGISGGSGKPYQWEAWLLPPVPIVGDVSDASAQKIDDSEWYTATVN
jgi:PIN domain